MNNHVESEVRVAVLIRKIIDGNRSGEGALTQGVLMTVFSHLETAWLQSYRDPCFRPAGIRPHRSPAAFPARDHFRRVNCYEIFMVGMFCPEGGTYVVPRGSSGEERSYVCFSGKLLEGASAHFIFPIHEMGLAADDCLKTAPVQGA